MTPEMQSLAHLLREAAATEIMPRFRHTSIDHKRDGSLVTEADLATQRHLTAALAQAYPGIPLLGEEMSRADQERLLRESDRGIWILDPLDGTSNYACGFPGFAISLALIQDGRTRLAAVLDPVRDECFTAAMGQGAFLNDRPIRPYAPGPALGDCLAAVDLKRLPPESLARLFRPGGFRSQRNLGSVALDWCWLAAGRFQLYLHGGQKLWDYAAGRLIAGEAGAALGHYRPDGTLEETLTLEPRRAIAAADETLFAAWRAFIELP